jgi:YesN/AraC family two-component response regulator
LIKSNKNENNLNVYNQNDSASLLKNKLIYYFENEKPFLNSHFSIDDLAENMNENKKIISKIINDEFDTNFNSFINKFRVIYAKDMITNSENKKLTLQAIAEMSGFNNRATFISSFKKFTGKTPSDFLT